MDMKELQKTVNPIYTTAKGTVLTLARAGDRDAIALLPYIGADELTKGSINPPPEEILRCYAIGQQARYEIHNQAALQSSAPNIVDLPSGYSPRGFRVASAGRRYLGFDLPIVIDTMRQAAQKTMTREQLALASYHAVDATNYESMKAALEGVRGELCIVTEGLLGYFSESELVSMCQAIHRLLSEYGGCWITADLSIIRIYALTFGVILKGDQAAFQERVKGHATRMADVEFYNNSLFTHGMDGAKAFLTSQGFSVREETVEAYLPDLPNVDANLMSQLRQAYRQMQIITMTAEAKKPQSDRKNLPFAVDTSFEDGKFHAVIQGRMDTITAPELLKKFQEASGKADAIEVDVRDMAYVSSAGLRVLLMMYKSLEDKRQFKLLNVSDEVKEILETTGFDQFLLKE